MPWGWGNHSTYSHNAWLKSNSKIIYYLPSHTQNVPQFGITQHEGNRLECGVFHSPQIRGSQGTARPRPAKLKKALVLHPGPQSLLHT